MIILFKDFDESSIQPVVICDFTRSDEQWSDLEIKLYISKFAIKFTKTIRNYKLFTLDYECEYIHSGINYGDSLKTRFYAVIRNAPTELVKLLNIEQYTSSQNVEILKKAASNIIDPQIIFPTGGIVLRSTSGEIITRQFMIYSTPYNFDNLRVNSYLALNGASYDSMVIRLNFRVYIKKNKTLLSQIKSILSDYDIKVDTLSSALLSGIVPKIDKYYSPKPLNSVLNDICIDNNLAFVNDNDTIKFVSLSPDSPPNQTIKNNLSFRNSVMGTKLISSFSLNNYVSCEFESEPFDPELFSSINIYDDSETSSFSTSGVESTLFSNLSKSPGVGKYSAYRFYVQEYTLHDSRSKTTSTVKATNNWLLNHFKLDKILENKIYFNNPGLVP